jgi:hypothetical protein
MQRTQSSSYRCSSTIFFFKIFATLFGVTAFSEYCGSHNGPYIHFVRSRQSLFVGWLFDFLLIVCLFAPGLPVTNAEAKSSAVNMSGLNGEEPICHEINTWWLHWVEKRFIYDFEGGETCKRFLWGPCQAYIFKSELEWKVISNGCHQKFS